MPEDKLPVSEFAARIKAKYPQYKDVDDYELAQKIVAKYPQYESQVDLKKKEQSLSSAGAALGKTLSTIAGSLPSPSNAPSSSGVKKLSEELENEKALGIKPTVDPKRKLNNWAEQERKRIAAEQQQQAAESTDPLGDMQKNIFAKSRPIAEQSQNIINQRFRTDSKPVQLPGEVVAEQGGQDLIELQRQDRELAKQHSQLLTTVEHGLDIPTPDADKQLNQWLKEKEPNALPAWELSKEHLLSVLPKDPQTGEPTLTAQSILNRFDANRQVLNSKAGTFEEWAKNWAQQSGKEDVKDLDFEGRTGGVSGAHMGSLLWQFAQQPAMKEWASQDPKKQAYYENFVQNIPLKYPDFGKTLLAQAITDEREKAGLNSRWGNFKWDTKEGKDKNDYVMDNLLKDGKISQQMYQFYQQNKDDIGDKIKTPGLVETFGGTVIHTADNLLNFPLDIAKDMGSGLHVYDKTGDARTAIADKYKETTLTVKDWWGQVAQATGQAAGFMLPLGGLTKVMTVAGVPSKAANAFAMAAATEHAARKSALQMFPDNELKQAAYTWTITALNGALGAVTSGKEKAIDGLKSVKGDIQSLAKDAVDKMTTTGINEAAKEDLKSGVAQIVGKLAKGADATLKHNLEVSFQMGGLTLAQDLADHLYGGRKVTWMDVANDFGETVKTMFIGNAPFAAMAARSGMEPKIAAQGLWEMTKDPVKYERLIKASGEIDPALMGSVAERLQNFELARTIKKEIVADEDLNALPEDKKADYLFQSVSQKVLEEKLKNTTDNVLREKIKTQIEQSKAHNEKIALKHTELRPQDYGEEATTNQRLAEISKPEEKFHNEQNNTTTPEAVSEPVPAAESKPEGQEPESAVSANTTGSGQGDAEVAPAVGVEPVSELNPAETKPTTAPKPKAEAEDFPHFREAMLTELENRSTDPLELKVKHPELPIEQKTILQGIKNIREGKQTKAAEAVEKAIQSMFDEGTVPYEQGAGKHRNSRGVPVSEMVAWQKALKETTPEQQAAAIVGHEHELQNEPLHEEEIKKWMEETSHFDNENSDNLEDYAASQINPPADKDGGTPAQNLSPEPVPGLPANDAGPQGSRSPEHLQQEPAETLTAGEQPQPEGSAEVTSIKNAVTKEEREARGKQEILIEQEAKRTFGQAFDRGKALVDNNEIDPRAFAQQLSEKPRPLSAEESSALLYDRMRLRNEYKQVTDALSSAVEAGDKETEMQLRSRVAYLDDAIETNDQAARKAGYEQGLGLAVRRMMLKEDYSLANQIRVMKAAKGEPLTDAERLHIEELTKKLEEATAKLEEHEKKIADLEADRLVKETQRAAKSQKRKATVDELKKEREQIKADLKDKWTKFSRGQLNAGVPLPVELVPDLVKLAKNYIQEGVVKVDELVDKIHNDVGEFIEGIEKRDIRDAISQYGKVRELSQEQIDIALRDLKGQMRELSKLEDLDAGKHPKRSGMQRDKPSDELRELQRKVYQKAKELGISFTGKTPEEAQRTALDAIKARLTNQIADLQKQIDAKEKSPKKTGVPYDDEANQLKAERDKLKQDLEDIVGKPEMSDEQRIEIARKAVERSIDDYERRIKEQDFTRQKNNTPETPELKALKEKRDKLKEQYEKMKPDSIRLEAALKAYKTRLTNRMAELEEKIAKKDFTTTQKKKVEPDMEAMQLQAEVQKVQDKFKAEKLKFERANRSKGEKALDWLTRWRRELLLTGIPTLGKLTVAASARIGFSPVEEMYGGMISKIPGLSKIAEKAPREGGVNIKAEAEAISKAFSYDTLNQMLEIVKTGKSREDRLFGKKADLPNEAFEFFGRVHGALKYTAKKAEIYRAFQKRAEFAAKKGFDISDPLVQATLWSDAYIDGNRAIFMNDNLSSDAYRSVLGYLRNKGPQGKVAASIGQILLPIVKVPSNFVLETTHYAFGVPKALVSIGYALTKGLDNISPQHADYIMRMLKKGSIGLALFAVGYYNPQSIGGYYTGKRKDDDLSPNDLKVFGVKIPHWAQHIPPIEVLQLGATVRRVQDAYAKKNKGEGGQVEGLFKGTVGLISEVPFIDQPKRLLKAATSVDEAGKYAADLGSSMVVPMGLKNIAEFTDTEKDSNGEKVKRKPQSIPDYLKQGIPGLRQQVPTKDKKKSGGLSGGLTGGLR